MEKVVNKEGGKIFTLNLNLDQVDTLSEEMGKVDALIYALSCLGDTSDEVDRNRLGWLTSILMDSYGKVKELIRPEKEE